LNRPDEAMAAYENNLAETARRNVAAGTVENHRSEPRAESPGGNDPELEKFLINIPMIPSPMSPCFRWASCISKSIWRHRRPITPGGQFRLPVTTTNRLPQALAEFEMLIQKFPGSPLAGKGTSGPGLVSVDRGQVSESLTAFKQAAGPVAVFRKIKRSPDSAG